ncbi:hypothetical protein Hhel01_03193 [Haloferula helveola]
MVIAKEHENSQARALPGMDRELQFAPEPRLPA